MERILVMPKLVQDQVDMDHRKAYFPQILVADLC